MMDEPGQIDRAFLRLAEGLVHYRCAGRGEGEAPPLYMAHAGPGSSRGLAPLMPGLALRRFVIAPDMLGNGESDPPARPDTDIAYYADCVVRILDGLRIDRVDFYGSHTGAQIGCAFAAARPDRLRKLILDGVPLFPPELKVDLLAHYAPQVEPDDDGDYLGWAWQFCRNQALYFPHYRQTPETRLANPPPSPASLHGTVVDVLKSLSTYRLAYQAAFSQDVRAVLPQIGVPVLLMASERDPLHVYLHEAAALVSDGRTLLLPRASGAADKVEAIRRFLDD
jgi:pimeloyl-ACP methyl ester carboxylesterase